MFRAKARYFGAPVTPTLKGGATYIDFMSPPFRVGVEQAKRTGFYPKQTYILPHPLGWGLSRPYKKGFSQKPLYLTPPFRVGVKQALHAGLQPETF